MCPARLLDLTRLVSRLGKGPMTGIDRVEFAYLSHLLTLDSPLFGLVRSAAGWLLLDQAGCAGLQALAGQNLPPGRADLLSRLTHRTNPQRAGAETAARRLATARVARPFLGRLLRRIPAGASYINVGHANLTDAGLARVRRAGLSVTVMIHDTIPLDHPQFARPGTVAPFRTKLAAVSRHADHVLHLTQATRHMTEMQFARLGRVPPGVTAAIGVATPQPDPQQLPPGLDLSAPYFVSLGTIEPRKNHMLLLDIWDGLGAAAPRLFILGARGWADPRLFARLDGMAPGGKVVELNGLPDGAVAAILVRATALLAPSVAEGFGLPPLEAASLGLPVIATDLAVTKELLGDKAVYLNPADRYSWMETIERQVQHTQRRPVQAVSWHAPTWSTHFKTVLSHA